MMRDAVERESPDRSEDAAVFGCSALHVLHLPSWYRTPVAPESGIFFREQADAVAAAGVKVGVVCPSFRSLTTLPRGAVIRNHFQTEWLDDEALPTLQYAGWAPPRQEGLKIRLWERQGVRLFEQYAASYGRPDLVHAQSALWAGAAAAAIRTRFDVPYLITEHSSAYARGLIDPRQAGRLHQILNDANQLLAVSAALRAQMRPYAGAARIDIVPNMVDTAFFTLPPQERPGSPFRFVAVASLVPLKGIESLLRAFAEAFAGRRDVVLEVGGAGPEQRALQDLAERLGIAEAVRFLGRLARDAVRAALWRAHCFVLPSLTESFGVVLIEALATGLPVIATRCGGPEDIVGSGHGLLVHPGDVAALAAALREAREAEGWQAGAAARREAARCQFGRQAVARQLLAHYARVAAPPRGNA